MVIFFQHLCLLGKDYTPCYILWMATVLWSKITCFTSSHREGFTELLWKGLELLQCNSSTNSVYSKMFQYEA